MFNILELFTTLCCLVFGVCTTMDNPNRLLMEESDYHLAEKKSIQPPDFVETFASKLPTELIEMILEKALYHHRPIDRELLRSVRRSLFRPLKNRRLNEIGERVFYSVNQFAIHNSQSDFLEINTVSSF